MLQLPARTQGRALHTACNLVYRCHTADVEWVREDVYDWIRVSDEEELGFLSVESVP